MKKIDIIIPLSNKSYQNCNDEIRLAIRSIKEFCNKWMGRIFVVTEYEIPDEIKNDVVIIPVGDIYTHEKDANIIHKIKTVINTVDDLSSDFIFWSDDNFVTQEITLDDFKPRYMCEYSGEHKQKLDREAICNTWMKRLVMTLNRFDNSKYFNPHIPSMMNKYKFIEMCDSYDYTTKHGITIFSWYYNFIKEKGIPNCDEIHLNRNNTSSFDNYKFVGYFDAVIETKNFRNKIQELFPGFQFKSKCKIKKFLYT